VSNEKETWLVRGYRGYGGVYMILLATQFYRLYRDYNKSLEGSLLTNQYYSGK